MMSLYLQNKRMLVYGLTKSYADIFCFSTTRYGGYSCGKYASFNCNHYCGDVIEHVERNRKLLISMLPQNTKDLIIPRQIHGTVVRVIDTDFMEKAMPWRTEQLEGVDALVTAVPGVCICISTADCIPVLCYDTRNRVIAAIHAGWRGTVGRIVEKTLRVMKQMYDTCGSDVVACIGPGISLEAFEVGEEVYTEFERAGFDMGKIACRKDKWHVDLWEANRLQLLSEGVYPENIELSGICTYEQHEKFFSARRMGIHSGRILSGIMIK